MPAISSMYLMIAPPKTFPITFASVCMRSLDVVIEESLTLFPLSRSGNLVVRQAEWFIKLVRAGGDSVRSGPALSAQALHEHL